MRSACLTALLLLSVQSARADFEATFEDVGVAPGSVLKDFRPGNSFQSGGFTFTNNFSPAVPAGPGQPFPLPEFYTGWVASASTDTSPTPPDYTHQFGAIPGTGSQGSPTYGILYNGDVAGGTGGTYVNLPSGSSPLSIDVTNTTYVYDSLTQGDDFAKKFAAGDFLKLDIVGYSGADGTGAVVGDVPFFLAKYATDADLPLSTWVTLDLTGLAGARSLGFAFTSSDNGQFGINTPTYVAADNLKAEVAAVPEPSGVALGVVGLTILAMAGRRGRASAPRPGGSRIEEENAR